MSKPKVIIVGSGFSGLSCACHLAKDHDVTVLEKNDTPGGRGRKFEASGFVFDMGPSWYWMPEIFEKFFNHFGKSVEDYYKLIRLDPSYKIFFEDDQLFMPANLADIFSLFESIEPGSSAKLKLFLQDAEYKFKVGMNEFVYKPSHSILEYADLRLLKSAFKLKLLRSISKEVQSKFKNSKLIKILEFPVLFLGAKPKNTPSMYSLMNYADLVQGTWYPIGGMSKIGDSMYALALELGVKFKFSNEVKNVSIRNKKIIEVSTIDQSYTSDYVINSADYNHFEQHILPEKFRMYSTHYWNTRTMAPSSLLFYLGINRKIDGLEHHNLFFDKDFDQHSIEIYDTPKWPSDPLFYVCCPSKTDDSVAPEGCENLFILMPLAVGLEDTDSIRAKYKSLILKRISEHIKFDIEPYIVYERSYAIKDFQSDYNSFKGNAYGLANTIRQTAFLKPKMKSNRVNNLFYTGQLTTPGPGVPPSIISGEVVAREVRKLSSQI